MRSSRGWVPRLRSGFRLEPHRILERKIDRDGLEYSRPVKVDHLFDEWTVRMVVSHFMVGMCDRGETISKGRGRPLHDTIIFLRIRKRRCYIWAASDDRIVSLSLALDAATWRECC